MKHRLLAIIVVCLMAMALSAPGHAATWSVRPAPSDDPDALAAGADTERGDHIFIWSREDGGEFQVYVEIHLAPDRQFGERMPIYQIDRNPPIDTEEIRKAGEAIGAFWGFTRKNTASWLLFRGTGRMVGPQDAIHQWLTGDTLAISYQDAAGQDDLIVLPLDGARDAVMHATRLDAR